MGLIPRRSELLRSRLGAAYTRLSPTFYRSRRMARTPRSGLAEVGTFCAFVGHSRSGHTLIASLLNAHQNIVISHELDALRYVAAGYSRAQLYELILERDAEFLAAGATWAGYDYNVPGEHQGSSQGMQVIGDKRAAAATLRFADDPEIFDRLRTTVEVPLRIIHVVRDPRDVIPTLMKRGDRTLDEAIEFYFASCPTLDTIHARQSEDLIVVSFENFVADPHRWLAELCEFLGVPSTDHYLNSCADSVFDTPRRTRDSVIWPPGVREKVEERISDYVWLAPYTRE